MWPKIRRLPLCGLTCLTTATIFNHGLCFSMTSNSTCRVIILIETQRWMTYFTTRHFLFCCCDGFFVFFLYLTCISIWVILTTFQLPHDIDTGTDHQFLKALMFGYENKPAVLDPTHWTNKNVSQENLWNGNEVALLSTPTEFLKSSKGWTIVF